MTPFYDENGITIYCGDTMKILPGMGWVCADAVISDPPYGEVSLEWDRWPEGWPNLLAGCVLESGSMWCFGSMRMFMERSLEFTRWRFVQDVIWEKHNGSNFIADRFRRVHEIATQWIRSHARWNDVYKSPVFTADATKRTVRRKERPPHTGEIENSTYTSEDGGTRLARSVIAVRSCHGHAVHPTQKPEGIIEPLLRYSCPPGGLVLSPFCGSGTDLVVARRLGLRAIGIEANESYCKNAVDRLRQKELFSGMER